MRKREAIPFTSSLSRNEAILVLLYIPMHVVVLQLLLSHLAEIGTFSQPAANLIYYAVGFVYMVSMAFGFLRRDFDPLADRPFRCLLEIISGYGWMIVCNFIVGMLLLGLPGGGSGNPNNQSIMNTAASNSRYVEAAVVYLAPVVEEMMFRAGIFGLIRRRSRIAAYAVSALLFSLYHVLPYAIQNPLYWVYTLQYLPVSLLLARCYERTNTIWGSVFFHMLVNGIAFSALGALQELM